MLTITVEPSREEKIVDPTFKELTVAVETINVLPRSVEKLCIFELIVETLMVLAVIVEPSKEENTV